MIKSQARSNITYPDEGVQNIDANSMLFHKIYLSKSLCMYIPLPLTLRFLRARVKLFLNFFTQICGYDSLKFENNRE